jgi:hypothetical protein
MTKLKIALVAAAGVAAFASPSFAQNFQGFGAPSSVTDAQQSAAQTQKPVSLKTEKPAKHVHTAR